MRPAEDSVFVGGEDFVKSAVTRPSCDTSESTMWGSWAERHLWTGALYGSPMNTRKSRLSPTGYVALAIIIVVLAYGLLYAARALTPAV
jgi:hypothetical protein